MIDKEYKCTCCGHAETIQVPDDWKEQHMYLPCLQCGNKVGLKMVVTAANIQRYGNQKGVSTWETIRNRPR